MGKRIKPEKPNAYKFERFVFDALPLAERTLAMETTRLKSSNRSRTPMGTIPRRAFDRH